VKSQVHQIITQPRLMMARRKTDTFQERNKVTYSDTLDFVTVERNCPTHSSKE